MNVIDLLQQLVRIPSVNPFYNQGSADTVGEGAVGEWLEKFLSGHGLSVSRVEVMPGRFNILAKIPGVGPACEGKPICLTAHLDVVPAEGMNIEPFSGELKDGRVWGRGADDTKSAIAAMTVAALRSQEEITDSRPEIHLLFTCDEEFSFKGSKLFAAENETEYLGVIAGEPTLGKIVTTHKGVARTRIRATGRAAHSSTPHEGVNAIYMISEAVLALRELADKLTEGSAHPLLGTGTLSVGTICGGTAVNAVPDFAEIAVDRRLLPGEDPAVAFTQIKDAVAGVEGITVPEFYVDAPGFEISLEHSWVKLVENALDRRAGEAVFYATDASFIHCDSAPCVVMGPGDIADAHTADESIAVEEVERAVVDYLAIIKAAGKAF